MFATHPPLSPGEVDYISTSCKRDCRLDGRAALELRPYSLEVNTIPTANGSARLRIETANILAVIKLDVIDLRTTDIATDLIKTSIDIKSAQTMDKQELSLLSTALATEIKAVLVSSKLITGGLLTIIPNEKSWSLSADITVFSHCGNMFDHSLIAIRAALATTTIPALRVVRKRNVAGQITEHSLELIPGKTVPLGAWDQYFPLPLSLCILNNNIVVDPSEQEECCIGSRYLVGFDNNGNVLSHTKVGVTGCSPQLYMQSLIIAESLGQDAYKYYLKALARAVDGDEKMIQLMDMLQKKLGDKAPLPQSAMDEARQFNTGDYDDDDQYDDEYDNIGV